MTNQEDGYSVYYEVPQEPESELPLATGGKITFKPIWAPNTSIAPSSGPLSVSIHTSPSVIDVNKAITGTISGGSLMSLHGNRIYLTALDEISEL